MRALTSSWGTETIHLPRRCKYGKPFLILWAKICKIMWPIHRNIQYLLCLRGNISWHDRGKVTEFHFFTYVGTLSDHSIFFTENLLHLYLTLLSVHVTEWWVLLFLRPSRLLQLCRQSVRYVRTWSLSPWSHQILSVRCNTFLQYPELLYSAECVYCLVSVSFVNTVMQIFLSISCDCTYCNCLLIIY